MLEFIRMMSDLPRDLRYSIGQDVRNKIMEIIVHIYRANRSRNKVHIILDMRELLLEIQVYIRLLCDLHCISERKFVSLVELTTNISKQMSAWEKSENRKQNGEQKQSDDSCQNING